MTEDTALTLDHVAVGYGRQVVLPDVDLRLPRGSFTGLLGANGSGKSTLLKTILGILKPLRGQVLHNVVDGRTPVLGYMPQRESLDPIYPLSSFEVVLMAACGRVGPGRFIGRAERDHTRRCLAETGAENLGSRQFSQLSGGQKQRVLMARALATKPDFLLLDEPTAGIDAHATRAVMDVLQEIHARHKQTVLLVSHDLATVRQYARDVIWLHEGSVVHGPVSEMLTHEKIEQLLSLDLR
ncbi:MAG TPA: metal ABC transporter ATP-binding protein [Candidatus Nitrosotalea sp.]|nr:metal ABC transporter ATP-binding protein [Candidatus Nitrosotalea sp.]